MVIVTGMRDDLRDEFAMADDAFALSPISARAALPSEADYDAIREAFMETTRGRWFLTEYAKRNRNADTTMVLDAVARIEQTLATQKQAAPDDGLARALAAIKDSLDAARDAAAAVFDKTARDEALVPIQKGVRIIREISWRWREIGADGRICDLLDSQANAIDEVHAQLAARDDAAALHAALGLIESTLGELSGSPAATASSTPTDTESSAVAEADQHHAPVSAAAVSEPTTARATASEAGTAAVARSEAPIEAPGDTTAHDEHAIADAADEQDMAQDMANDDAVLDMIALEMGAADFDEPEADYPGAGASILAEPESALEPATIADTPDTSIAPDPAPLAAPSLGASLLANGIVSRGAPRSDPLAAIRSMTQAEKIAFFS